MEILVSECNRIQDSKGNIAMKITLNKEIKMTRKSMLLGAALALVSMSAFAQAETVALCAGAEGGNYDKVMRAVGGEIERKGHTVTYQNLRGSEEILQALEKGTCDYGPAQRNVFYMMTQTDSSFSTNVRPAQFLYNEAMQGYCSKSSKYDELEDIQVGDKIIIDSFGSGSALTWQNIVAIEKEFGGEDDWSKAIALQTPLADAAADISVGEAKCAFGVSGIPAPWMMEGITNGGTVMYIYDGDINDLEVDGESLFESLRVAATNQYKQKFDTYKIPATLFRSAKTKVSTELNTLIKRVSGAEGAKKNTIQ